METIILPGYSIHNKAWAEEIRDELSVHSLPAIIHEWQHWSSRAEFTIKREVESILIEAGQGKVNLLAKSVGIAVALHVIPEIPAQVNKVILCGIASTSSDIRKAFNKVIQTIPPDRILCIQNEFDKFVKYKDARDFYHSVNPEIRILSKPRNDHHYPYAQEFIHFFKNG